MPHFYHHKMESQILISCWHHVVSNFTNYFKSCILKIYSHAKFLDPNLRSTTVAPISQKKVQRLGGGGDFCGIVFTPSLMNMLTGFGVARHMAVKIPNAFFSL
jgi:hypothetical protein